MEGIANAARLSGVWVLVCPGLGRGRVLDGGLGALDKLRGCKRAPSPWIQTEKSQLSYPVRAVNTVPALLLADDEIRSRRFTS